MRAVLLLALVACTGEVDPQWQLDHDRVIAVRMTPPHIMTGETSVLDGLIGRKGDTVLDTDPDTAEIESPMSVPATLLTQNGTHWQIARASDDDLVAARTELGLGDTDEVPVSIRMVFAYQNLVAHKLVYMGDVHADNPALGAVLVNGVDVTTETDLKEPPLTDIPLAVDFPETWNVNWLSSCGTMHDFDLATAYLRIEQEDPQTGEFGVTVRDLQGGVAWQFWPIAAAR
jgi:hypothetical protein